uniref:Metalloendopeptidase n=1 Tax=Parastrongyloides trichosuri TaxID=131310 RepID=A0A0N4ZDE3_PARTI
MFYQLLFLSILGCLSSIIFGEEDSKIINKRAILKRHVYNYSTNINYWYEGSKIEAIDTAVKHLSQYTCLEFRKRSKKLTKRGLIFEIFDFKQIIDNLDKNEPSIVRLDGDCAEDVGCVKHMLALALGLIPHHNRWDRDKYVTVNKKNINDDFKMSYNKVKGTRVRILNTAFDFGSITNYDPFETSKKNLTRTYKSKLNPLYNKMLGQRHEFSHNDLKLLNDFYCGKSCAKKLKGCRNGGFQDPNQCNACRCPLGYDGKYCDKIKKTDYECGKRFYEATKGYQTFAVNGTKICNYFIQSPPGTKVELHVVDAYVRREPRKCVENFGIEIKNRHDRGTSGLVLCGRNKNVTIKGVFSQVLIHYIGFDNTDYATFKYRAVKRKNTKSFSYDN